MFSSRFIVKVEAPNTATRPNGVAAREKLKELLAHVDVAVVDLDGIVLTPSFADEFLGILLQELGEPLFKQSVKIENVAPSARPLLQTVLFRRSKSARPPEAVPH